MAGTLGTVYGQVQIDTKQAVAAYAALRASNAATLYALRGGSTAFAAAGGIIAGAGIAIGAGFVKGIKAAAEFEKQLDFFGAVSNSTASEMEAVRKKALQLGKDTIYSAAQIGDSFVELGKAGISAAQIVGGVGEAVASLGAAADIPLDKAANIITSAVQTFKLGAKDAVHVADLLAGAANASIVEVEDLGVSLKYVGGVAASISLPIEDVIDAISLLGKAGIRGSTAGTSLRQILVSLTGTSQKANKVLKELGIITADGTNQFFTAAGKAKPLADIFQILHDKTQNLTEAQRLSAFKIIFNNRALAAANILARDGAAGFAAMNKEISKTTAADVASKRLDNLSGDIEILRGNIETLFIEAGTPFQNFLRGIVQGLTSLLAAFSKLSPGQQEFIFKALAVTAVVLTVLGTMTLFISMAFKMYESFILLKGGLTVVKTVILSVAKAMRVLSLSLLTNPVFLIIAAIALLVVGFILLYKNSERFRKIVNAVGAALVVAFKATVNFFKGLPAFFQGVWAAITGFFTSAKDAVVGAWNAIGAFFSNLWNTIVAGVTAFGTGFVNFWKALPGRILAGIKFLVEGIINYFRQLPEQVAYAIGFMVGRAVRLFLDLQNFLFNAAKAIVNGVINFFIALPGRIANFFTDLYNKVKAIWVAYNNWLINAAKSIVSSVINFFKALPGQIANFFQVIYLGAVAKWTAIKNWLRSAAFAIALGIVNALKALPGQIATIFQNAYNDIVKKLNAMISFAKSAGIKLKDGFIDAIKGLPQLFSDLIQRAINTVASAGSAAYNKAKSVGASLWQGFKDGVGIHSPSYIEKAMFQMRDTMAAETKGMERDVLALQGLGSKLPNIQEMIAATKNAQADRTAASAGTIRPAVSSSSIQAALAEGSGGPVINLTTNNPVGETTVETLSKEATRLSIMGVLG